MNANIRCQFCEGQLDLGQQFAFLVETATRDNPIMLAAIRRLPAADGVPLRCCKGCQTGIEQRRFVVRDVNAGARRVARRGGQLLVLAVFAVGFGVLTTRLP